MPMNHAEEYKAAVENENLGKMTIVIADWINNGSKDALFGLAMTILTATRNDVPFSEIFQIYKMSLNQDASDESLLVWYRDTSIKLMKEIATDEIRNNPKYSEIFECGKSSTGDEGYAKRFTLLLEKLGDSDDPLEDIKFLSEMTDIIGEWGEKYPDDANMICAHIIMRAGFIEDDEMVHLMVAAHSKKPIDESCYGKLLEEMTKHIVKSRK